MRVTENTSRNAVHDALGRTRSKIEDLQLKNATLKKLNAPSDDPVSNAKLMDIRTQSAVNSQFEMNAKTAKDRLQNTENAVQELTDILIRAKDIALNQASGPSATAESRLGVAQEVSQMYKQIISISNRRVGDYYLFSGYKTLTAPYTPDGSYLGDHGETSLEIQKGVTVGLNVPGPQVFQVKKFTPMQRGELQLAEDQKDPIMRNRAPASAAGEQKTEDNQANPTANPNDPTNPVNYQPMEVVDLFKVMQSLRTGLMTNDTETIRGSMEALDTLIENTVSMRAKIGSRVAGIDAAIGATDKQTLQNAMVTSQLEDADFAELWASLAKEETVLRSSLQAAQKLIQPTLLDFLR